MHPLSSGGEPLLPEFPRPSIFGRSRVAPGLNNLRKCEALHEFDDDLREGLGLTTLYNQALGTTCDDHLYDRVEDRDAGPKDEGTSE